MFGGKCGDAVLRGEKGFMLPRGSHNNVSSRTHIRGKWRGWVQNSKRRRISGVGGKKGVISNEKEQRAWSRGLCNLKGVKHWLFFHETTSFRL